MGAYVALLEYDDVEGMILLSELSRRRIRSINKLIRVGRVEYVVVLRVDRDKGYIDLSKRRVAHEDVVRADQRYTKAKAVHSLLRHLAASQRVPLEQLYERVAWPLADAHGHAYDAFKLAVSEPDAVFGALEPPLEPALRDAALAEIRERFTPQAVRVRADVEVTCFACAGVDAIRTALEAGQACQTEQMPIKVKLLAPPLYVLWCAAIDKDAGIALLEQAIAKAEQVVKEHKGELQVKVAPRAVTEREDAELRLGDDELSDDDDDDDDESGSESD